MGKTLTVGPFKKCPYCGKKGYRATNIRETGKPIMRCRYCGVEVER